MVTSDTLAELLATVNVVDVAREANVSTKTIYRLRHKQHSPTLDTVERIIAAVERINRASKREAARASQAEVDRALCGAARPDYAPRSGADRRRDGPSER